MRDWYLWLDENRSVRRTLICADFVVTPETTEGPRAHKAQISLATWADWHFVVRNPPCFRHDLSILDQLPMLPTNRPPTHPGEMLLKEFLEPLGVSQAEAAKRVNIPFQRLNAIIKGRRGVSADTAPCSRR